MARGSGFCVSLSCSFISKNDRILRDIRNFSSDFLFQGRNFHVFQFNRHSGYVQTHTMHLLYWQLALYVAHNLKIICYYLSWIGFKWVYEFVHYLIIYSLNVFFLIQTHYKTEPCCVHQNWINLLHFWEEIMWNIMGTYLESIWWIVQMLWNQNFLFHSNGIEFRMLFV